MKGKSKSTVGLLFLLPLASHAQTAKPQQPVKTGNEWKRPSDVFQRAKIYSANLRKKLGLDSVETKKVYDLFLANTKPLDEIAVASVSEKEKAAMIKSNQAAFNEKIKSVLSEAQYSKYLQIAQ